MCQTYLQAKFYRSTGTQCNFNGLTRKGKGVHKVRALKGGCESELLRFKMNSTIEVLNTTPGFPGCSHVQRNLVSGSWFSHVFVLLYLGHLF